MPVPSHVKNYECTVYYTSTGSSHTKEYPFTEAHAREMNTVLEPNGIPLWAAGKLCEQWNRRSKHSSIRYSYRLPSTT